MGAWYNPVTWYDDTKDAAEDAVGATEDAWDDVAKATSSVTNNVADDLVDVGNTLVSTGSSLCDTVADGTVATFQTVSGGIVYAVDWTATETSQLAKYATSASGDIATFSVELYGNAKTWAEDTWKYLSSYLMQSPPSLGAHNSAARDFMKGVLRTYVITDSAAEAIVSSWERDARKKGYTMAIDFDGGIQLANITSDVVLGVYVDKTSNWGFFASFGVSATITLSASASITMDLYMLFGGADMYTKKYYFAGGTFDIGGFIVGGDVLVTSGFDFAGFKATIGFGVSYDLFSSGGSSSAKSASSSSKSVDVSPTLPSLDVYSVDLLGEQGSTTDVACQAAASSSQATSIATNASAAMTMKSSTILVSEQVGGTGGGVFSDDVTNVERIRSITIHGGKYVDALSITYVRVDGSTFTTSHGGSGGGAVTLDLADDEYITKITGRAGKYLYQVCFTTSHGRTLSKGGSGGSEFTIDPKLNRPIIGIFGRSGDYIDALGVYYRSGKPFTIQSKKSGLYLDLSGQMSASDGASTMQQSATGGPHQRWLLVPGAVADEYTIVNEHTGLYLGATGATKGSSIVESPASGSDNQLWVLTAQSSYTLVKNKGTGLYMDVQGVSTAPGAVVYVWSYTGADNQLWRLAPAPTRVFAFSGGGYGGSFQAFGPGSYNMSQLSIGNDTIQSIRVPEGWRVTLYADANYSGTSQVLTRDASSLGSMSGQVSSLKVEAPPWGAAAYTDNDYAGASRTLMPGRYPDIRREGLPDNALSSVKVPAGWRVTLFQDFNFGGNVTTLTSDTPRFSDLGVNDTASGLVVEEAPLGQVVLYTGTRFSGRAQVLGPGRFDLSVLMASGGVGNDTVKSVKVPPRWTVVLYKDQHFAGTTVTLTASSSDLGDFVNQASSLVIIPG